MGAVLHRLQALVHHHRSAASRIGLALLALALGLLAVGGTLRLLRAADRGIRPLAPSRSPTPTWTARLDAPVTGLAIDDGRLYVASDQLTIFPVSCVTTDDGCPPRWRGVVPDGPLSAPTVLDDRVFVGSSLGQLYAFPAGCDGDDCPPEWVGIAGSGPVSQPAANFDLVYATSDELYAFPVGCGSDDATCSPVWTADVRGRPAAGPPALGGGLVVVASSSRRGGVTAYPAACSEDCRPAWRGRTGGPATSVAIGGEFAFTVARGQLMAFPLSCSARCDPAWRAPFVPGGPFATHATNAPAVAGGRVLVGDERGRLWVFRSTCDDDICEPVAAFDVATTPLHTPVVEGDRVIVASDGGSVAEVLLDCAPDEGCEPVQVHRLGAPGPAAALIAPDATIAGAHDGSIEAFTW
jgi:outer membrane protein assembly factor BamB